MQAERIVITKAGGPGVLAIERFDPPSPGPGEVAVEVRAVGVNFADLFCRLGLYAAAPPIPFVPGFEVSGTVVEAGAGVVSPAPGDRVLALTRFGGYASRLCARAEWTRPLPDDWSFEDGAAFPVVFLTAWHGLVHVGRLARGETVVVQSAAGGVGTAACQLARSFGARVIGTVGSEAKRQLALDSGADEVVVSRDYAVWDEIDRLTDGGGVDVILDAVGGRGLRQGYARLRPGGRLLVYGFAEMMPRGGVRNWPRLLWKRLRLPRFDPMGMTSSNRTVSGFNLVYLWNRKDLLAPALDALLAMGRDGAIRPTPGRSFPFDRAPDAHAYVQSRASTGKVLLVR